MIESAVERKRRLNKEWMVRDYQANPDKYRKRALVDHYNNRDIRNQKQREWYRNNPARRMMINARSRAKAKNLEFNIDESDIIIPTHCPILGIELELGTGKIQESSPTLDRIDNDFGYIKGNVAVISNKANRHKGDLTIRELERLLSYCKGELI